MASAIIVSLAMVLVVALLLPTTWGQAEGVLVCDTCPRTMGVAQGQIGVFVCSSYDPQMIWWIVNDFRMSTEEFDNLGLDVISEYTSGDIFVSNLSIPANMITHNALIVCGIAPNKNFMGNKKVDPVNLIVQGPYDPVPGINITNTSYEVELSWATPPHHPDVPPTDYNVTITNFTTDELLISNTTSQQEYMFEIQPSQLCSILRIQVVAFNQYLVGSPRERIWSLGSAVEPSSISPKLIFTTDNPPLLHLSVNFTVVGYCLNLLDTITLDARCGNDTFTNTSSSGVMAMSGVSEQVELSVQGLPEDRLNCFFAIILETITSRTVPSQSIPFTTFDVSEVVVTTDTVLMFCVECEFLQGTPARGCSITQLDQDNNVILTDDLLRPNGVSFVMRCYNSSSGAYTVEVYGIKASGNRTDEPFRSVEIVVSSPPVVVTSPSPTPLSTPTVLTTEVIAGIAVGALVFIVILVIIVVVVVVGILYFKYRKNYLSIETKGIRTVALDSIPTPEGSFQYAMEGWKHWKEDGHYYCVCFKEGVPLVDLKTLLEREYGSDNIHYVFKCETPDSQQSSNL